jgi:hypothetical protein
LDCVGWFPSGIRIGCGKSGVGSISFSRANASRATVSKAFSTLTPSLADVSKWGILDFSKKTKF